MLRQYRYLAPVLTFCTLLAMAGMAHAATTITPDAPPTAAETAAAHRALSGEFRKAEAAHQPLKFTVGHADLNGDGKPDLIIHYTNNCVLSGCSGYALLAVPGGYSTHAIELVFFGQTMTILNTMHHGMHSLRYDDSTYVFRWTGTAYQGSAE